MQINNKEINDWVIIGVAAVVVMAIFGIGPVGDWYDDYKSGDLAANSSTQTVVSSSNNVPLSLDAAFISVVSNSQTLADVDNNYNDDTNVVSLQVDAEYGDDGSETYFVIKTKNTAGTVVELLNFTETGVLTTPETDQSVLMTINIDESVLGGFADTNEVEYSKVSASANRLLDNSGNYFYPITTKTGDSTTPEVKVDGQVDSHSYSWTAISTTKNIDVTGKISWTGISKMDDISDKITIPVILESADDTPIKIELIRNTAI